MTRRIVAILVAVALAAVGAVGVLIWALKADQRVRDRLTDAVTVAIATKPIPAGYTGGRVRAEGMFRLERMPRTSVPQDFLADVGADEERKVVMSNIATGQILYKALFGQPGIVTAGLSLPDGKMALTVKTGVPEQVAGYVQPGSKVAIFLTYNVTDSNSENTGDKRTRVLLASVDVLAVGGYRAPRNDGVVSSNNSEVQSDGELLLTLAVDQTEAERLIHAVHTGELYCALITDSIILTPGAGVDNRDAGSGTTPLFPSR
jgi:pilus assembly protein CpaB